MNTTDSALWGTLLWATTDPDTDGEYLDASYDLSDVDLGDAARLNKQFWQWRDSADDLLIHYGFGDKHLEDLLGVDRVEHCYALVRDGHGVNMTDRWQPDTEEWRVCRDIQHLAALQGPIGAYPDDGGRIYCTWGH